MRDKKICIVGMGLLGGSFAMGLIRAGNIVYGIDICEESIAYAKENGYITDGSVSGYGRFVSDADIVVLCLYPHVIIDWVKKNAALLKKGAVVTDVCGVKCGIVEKVQSILGDKAEFYSGHPMRGKEVLGVKNADCGIFKNANYILTPTKKNTKEAEAVIRDMAETLGFVTFSILSPEQHDKMVGYVSQLTHVIAVSLMTAADRAELAPYAGDSFRDLTRIATIDETLWSELFLRNRKNLIEEIDRFCASMKEFKEYLDREDEVAIKELLRLSTERRRRFDKS